ncbi:tetratricopeptide repeat protein [Mucilaginibacter sp. AW1-3]
MPFSFLNGYSYYYIPVLLQAFCCFHAYRRGTLNNWIWMIVFLPLIGSIIYLFSEVFSTRGVRRSKIDVGAIVNPGGKLKKLESELRFSDTFANKIRLADAYLAAGQLDSAQELYENALTGSFADNEHGLSQLLVIYYKQERYTNVIDIAKKINRSQKFPKSTAHLLYAQALEHTGNLEAAEKEFKAMKGRYSCFEQRYEYGLFLKRHNRPQEAERIFNEILDEVPQLSSMERKGARAWAAKAKLEVRDLVS